MRNRFTICVMMAALSFVFMQAAPASAEKFGEVSPATAKDWRDFRAGHPFHNQIVAVSDPRSNGERSLLITEPSPSVTWESLSSHLRSSVSGCSTAKHDVMFDGWIYDVVCTLPSMDEDKLNEFIGNLHVLLFTTTHGAQAIRLPAPPEAIKGPSLDYRFTATDLERWLIDAKPRFTPMALSSPATFPEIMAKRLRGVFVSEDAGLTLWAIDRNGSIDGESANIRRFAIEGDLVLAGVADADTVAIVARKRIEPLTRLPPLRAETLLLLAGVRIGEISQSYERNHLLSGKGLDAIDHAPILLSPEIVDTELGSLLNITDQLLKGWSEAGTVTYERFPYPKPARWPFDQTPASKVEKHRERFLFNWNTDGAAYIQAVGSYDVVSPQRTGALSIIYGDPQDRPRDMEATAYDYFARSGDANLNRALQYSFIYQMFKKFGISASKPAISVRHTLLKQKMKELTRAVLTAIPDALDAPSGRKRLHSYLAIVGQPDSIESKLWVIMASGEATAQAKQIKEMTQESGGTGLADLIEILASPRDFVSRLRDGDQRARAILHSVVEKLKLEPDQANGLRGEFDAVTTYARQLGELGLIAIANEHVGTWKSLQAIDPPERQHWIRTAYVVSSTPHDAAVVGGHNINPVMTQMKLRADVPAGTIRVDRDPTSGNLTVYYNEADKVRLRDVSRLVGTRKELPASLIQKEVNAELGRIGKPQPVELASLTTRSPESVKILDYASISEMRPGLLRRAANENEAKLLGEFRNAHHPTLIIEGRSDGTVTILSTGSKDAIVANTVAAINDAITINMLRGAGLGTPVKIVVRGMPDAKAQALVRAANDNIARLPRDSAKSILVSAREGAIDVPMYKALNTPFARNGIKVDRTKIGTRRLADGPFAGATEISIPLELPASLSPNATIAAKLVVIVKELSAAAREALIKKIVAQFEQPGPFQDMKRVVKDLFTTSPPTTLTDVQLELKQVLTSEIHELQIQHISIGLEQKVNTQLHQIDISGAPHLAMDDAG